MKFKSTARRIINFIYLQAALFLLPVYVFGGSQFITTTSITNPLKVNSIQAFITLLLDTLFPIAAILSVFFLIYAGFLMVMAGGSEEKLSKAKQALIWTMIGVAILLGAKVISVIICGTIQQLGSAGLACNLQR
jgi:hypothetical protein